MKNNIPGTIVPFNGSASSVCEVEGCENTATVYFISESDSMGNEYSSYCQGCYDEFMEEKSKPSTCPVCHKDELPLVEYRCMDEIGGPIYEACEKCYEEIAEREREAMMDLYEDDEHEALDDPSLYEYFDDEDQKDNENN